MAGATKKGEGRPSIIIRKEEVVEGGHHGGAWKVAYADFVTAMMAFFLLMWLLNATTEDQRRGLADYFSPTSVIARSSSGFGAPFGGHTPNDDGSLASDRGAVQLMNASAQPVFAVDDDDSDVPAQAAAVQVNGSSTTMTRQLQNIQAGGPAAKTTIKPGDQTEPDSTPAQESQHAAEKAAEQKAVHDHQVALDKQERATFQQAAQQMREMIAHDPGLAELAHQISIDIIPEGLRIQILDEDGLPMFATGSAVLNERARLVLQKVVPVLMKLPESLSIAGHTDGAPFRGVGGRSNWELSAERANATRRLFAEAGLPESRVQTVTGLADRDPLLPADPLAAANRRIAIVVLRSAALKPKA